MEILAWTVLLVAATGGVLLVPFGLAGQFAYPAGLLGYLLIVGEVGPVSWTQLWIFLGIAVVVEVMDSVLGMIGGRKAGGSRAASFGALIGGFGGAILGSILIPIPFVGGLIGVLLGTFTGAALLEYHRKQDRAGSLKVGAGAFIGRLLGIVLKGATAMCFLTFAVLQLIYTWIT